MIFILLTFLAAFSIEALGTIVSIIGLTSLFGMNAIIISLAVALDLGKIVVVTLLYSYFKQLGVMMRSYAVIASIITMVITSAGAGAYLTAEFQKAILGSQEGSLKVQVLKDQQAKYEERKKQIDLQIANLPEKTSVNQRLRLMNGFKTEQKDLQDKITEIDKQLPALQINQIGVESKVGPILYIAKAFNIPVEEAVKWVILMIIVVFDPLAVFLIVAGNFLLEQRKISKEIKEQPEMFKTPNRPTAFGDFVDKPNAKYEEDIISTSSNFLPEDNGLPIPSATPPMPPVKPPKPDIIETRIDNSIPIRFVNNPEECIIYDTLEPTCIINDTLSSQGTIYDTLAPAEPLPERKPPVMENSVFHSAVDEEDPYEHSIEPPEPETIVDVIPEEEFIQQEEKTVIEQVVTEDPIIQESIQEPISAAISETIPEDPEEPAQLEKKTDADLEVMETPIIPESIPESVPERDTITLSSLGYVKPDEHTITDSSLNEEIGYMTGVYKSGSKPH